ncbi:MAG: metal-sensitive transcriptional regulator [Thermaceae bacterium]|nr:metal-sensitive transcriptional regulator [Thermaceae bacterium]
MTTHDLSAETQAAILKRLRRIEGQVRGLQKMVEEGRPCDDMLTQMNATKKALESASILALQEFLAVCTADLIKGKKDKPAQIAEILRKFSS